MLRINLLPPYIYEGAKRTKLFVVWVILLAAVIGGFLFWKHSIDTETARIKDEEAKIKPQAEEATAKAGQASRINSESAVIRGKADFVTGAISYDQKTYQEMLTNVARYTWPRVLYDSINPAGSTVTMGAYAPSLADVGHYMMYMERNPAISRVDIAMNSIPGFPSDGAQAAAGSGQQGGGGVRPFTGGGHDFQVSLTLVKPIPGSPTYPSGGGGAAAGPGGGGPADLGGPGGAGGSGGMMMGGSGGAPAGGSGGMGSGGMGGKAGGIN